jgi:hypothetical protein
MQHIQGGINKEKIAQIDNMDERRFGQELAARREEARANNILNDGNAPIHGDVQDNEALAGFYATKGKMDEAAKYRKQAEFVQNEGMGSFARNIQTGMPYADARKIYNATGSDRLPEGDGAYDAATKNLTFTDAQGKSMAIHMPTAERYLLDVEKRGKVDKTQAETIKTGKEAEHVTAQTLVIPAESSSKIGLQQSQSDNLDATASAIGITAKPHAAALNAQASHSNAQTSEIRQKVVDKKDLSKIHTTLNNAINSGDKTAETKARSELAAYASSGKGEHLSPEERRSNFYLASGVAKTPEEAARMAHEKTQNSPGDDYIKFSTSSMPLTGKRLDDAMATLHGLDWKTKLNPGSRSAAPVVTPKADYDKLPSGSKYTGPDGKSYIKR